LSSTGSKKNYQYLAHSQKVSLIEKDHENITLRRQCQLLGISRESIYYHAIEISPADKKIMDLIDKIYTAHPFYGNRRIKAELNLTHHIPIGRGHVRTLMRTMGLEALYPKKNLSWKNKQHKVYPYLLRNLKIEKPNQVWSTDITYVKLTEGFAYLIAVIDWFSRYVLSWKLSNSLDIDFCLECLQEALAQTKNKPEIFNSDQGSHFTSPKFTEILEAHQIRISMDGRGRCLDNIFVERLWRTVKQENIYLNSYQNVLETKTGLDEYFLFYNDTRRHQSLEYLTPKEVHFK
jgi:putative transposase